MFIGIVFQQFLAMTYSVPPTQKKIDNSHENINKFSAAAVLTLFSQKFWFLFIIIRKNIRKKPKISPNLHDQSPKKDNGKR